MTFRYKRTTLWSSLTFMSIVFFQNCSPQSAQLSTFHEPRNVTDEPSLIAEENTGEVTELSTKSNTRVNTCSLATNPSSSYLCPTAEQRKSAFAEKYNKWDMEWDGRGTPGDSRRPYQVWFDNPYEDDMEEHDKGHGACKMHFDSPAGFLSVDRIFRPSSKEPCPTDAFGNKVGKAWLMRRDPKLVPGKTGLTFEFRMQLVDHRLADKTQEDSILFHYKAPTGFIRVALNPGTRAGNGCIKVFSKNRDSLPGNCDAENTVRWSTVDWTIYRIVVRPDLSYDVYASSTSAIPATAKPLVTGYANKNSTVGYYVPGKAIPASDSRNEFPSIDLGVHGAASGAYNLDFVRYVRGMAIPGGAFPDFAKDIAPVLPLNKAVPPNSDQKGPESVQNLRPRIFSAEGLKGNGDWTVELRARAGAKLSSQGFALKLFESMGTITLVLSKDKVELSMGAKILSYSKPVKLDATVFNTYRLVKYGHLPYVYLYINDEPRPVIADFPMSVFSMNSTEPTVKDKNGNTKANPNWAENAPTISYGWLAHRMPAADEYNSNYEPFKDGSNKTVMDVDIEYLRWSSQPTQSARTY